MWYENFAKQFADLASGLGFAAGDVTAIDNDNDVMQFIGGATVEMKAVDDGLRQYRIGITEGNIGDPTPGFPAMPVLTLPVAR